MTSSTALPTAMASGLPPKVRAVAAGGRRRPRPCPSRGRRPAGKPPPMPLAVATMSGVTPAHSWANSLPVRPMPRLHLVEEQQQAELVARPRAGPCRYSTEAARMPPSPCTGSTRMAAVSGLICGAQLVQVAERHLVEAFDVWARSPSDTSRCRRRRWSASVRPWNEPSTGDDAVALGIAEIVVILAHQLEAALDRLGARNCRRTPGPGRRRSPPTSRSASFSCPGTRIEIGGVPDLGGLLVQRRDQVRMAMARAP